MLIKQIILAILAILIATIVALGVPNKVSSSTPKEIPTTEEVPVVVIWDFDTLITHLAEKYGQDEALARKIIRCESGNKKDATNENLNEQGEVWSIDWGYWQINDYWHLESARQIGLDVRYSWEDNLEYGFLLLRDAGAMRHWSASAYCWNK